MRRLRRRGSINAKKPCALVTIPRKATGNESLRHLNPRRRRCVKRLILHGRPRLAGAHEQRHAHRQQNARKQQRSQPQPRPQPHRFRSFPITPSWNFIYWHLSPSFPLALCHAHDVPGLTRAFPTARTRVLRRAFAFREDAFFRHGRYVFAGIGIPAGFFNRYVFPSRASSRATSG
jgi:hypothetical protein